MKIKFSLSLVLMLNLCLLTAQVPQGFNYQAIARGPNGKEIVNINLSVRISILADTSGFYNSGSGVYVWEEEQTVMTNNLGLFNIVIGNPLAIRIRGTSNFFYAIDWSTTPLYIGTKIFYQGNWINMGASRLWSVPYSMLAGDLSGSVKRLSVAGQTSNMEEALFEVKNKNGQTVFAVYNEGVRIYVEDDLAKGVTKGGFAIGGFGTVKAPGQEYLRVTPDSTRVYVDNNVAKGVTKGGFAIGGFGTVKDKDHEYLRVTSDSVKVSKSLLIPRLTTEERDHLTFEPGEALIIFNMTEGCMQIFKNKVWSNIWCFNCAPAFIIQPVDKIICSGEDAVFFISATGTSLSYQWQESTDNGISWHNVSNGGTAPAYSGCTGYSLSLKNIPVSNHNFRYRCFVTGSCLPNVISNIATLSVGSTPPVFALQPVNQQLSASCTATFSINSPGYGLVYKWQQSSDGGSTWNPLSDGGSSPVFSGSSTSSLSLFNVPWSINNSKYRCIISNACGSDATSDAATLIIVPSTIVVQPENQLLKPDCSASFSIAVPPGYIAGYQWQVSSNSGGTWTNISDGGTNPLYSGAATQTLSINSVPISYNSYQYRCIVNSLCGPNETSNAATLTIQPATIVTQPTDQELTIGCIASFSINITAGYTVSYKWQVSSNGGSSWANIADGGTSPVYSGASSATLNLSNVPVACNNYQYRCTVSSLCGPNETSATATLSLNSSPIITAQPENRAGNPGMITVFRLTTSGTGFIFKWQESSDGGSSWSDISDGGSIPGYSGSTTTDLMISKVPLSHNGNKYRCHITHNCHPDVLSDAAILSVSNTTTVSDIDGNVYNTVKINTQEWMAENLKTTKYNDGTNIPLVTTGWIDLITPAYCWSGAGYGALYNWYAVSSTANGNKNVCPTGWHMPTDDEWATMEYYLSANGYNYDGTIGDGRNKIAKSLASTALWFQTTTIGAVGNEDYPDKRNATGFTALPSGLNNGSVGNLTMNGYWWTATHALTTLAWSREFSYNASYVIRASYTKAWGFSVRCIKD